jgi:hypothetical protein
MRTASDKVAKETKDLEMVIDKKVSERMNKGSNKWGQMGFKSKLEVIFLGMGIVAFTSIAFKTLKSFRFSPRPTSDGTGISE